MLRLPVSLIGWISVDEDAANAALLFTCLVT
jgi:hypothetical protein